MLQRILLGPQRPERNLDDVFAAASLPPGPVAVISAGWQEAEGDIDDVGEAVGRPLVDLNLYHRAEALFAAEPALLAAYRERQDRLKDLQRLYRIRLRHSMLAARLVRRADAAADLVATEQRHAVSQLRALDRHHLNRVQAIQRECDERIHTLNSSLLAEHIAAIETAATDCQTILITGGNVVVLLNRLQLYDISRLFQTRHIVCWSAGAMVLSDLIVLYHDHMPQGRRDPEVLGEGSGVLPGYVFLPDATRRLKGKDRVRVGVFRERFAPARCVTLNSGAAIRFADQKLVAAEAAGSLMPDGRVARLRGS